MPAKFQFVTFNDVNLPKRPYINVTKDSKQARIRLMWRIIKWLIYLAILAALALIAYAYLGPFFGADFSAPLQEIRVPVDLNGRD
jgi:hypothetical protein